MSFASNRDSGNFSSEYKKTGFFQAGYNEIFLDAIVEHLRTHLPPSAKIKKHRILDLGCGTGNSTFSLQQKLQKAGIPASIKGTDISPAMIQAAKKYQNEHLSFEVQDADQLQDKNQYDLIICLFAYHWFHDKAKVAERIQQALKPQGLFFALIPLEKPLLFALRQNTLRFWQPYLDDVQLKPLIDDPKIYTDIFAQQFPHCQAEYKRNHHEFSSEKFSEWLSSWTAEGRAMTTKTRSKRKLPALLPQQKRQMMDQITASIPEEKNEDISVSSSNQQKIIDFGERILAFAGSRKPLSFTLKAPDVDASENKEHQIKRFI